MTKRSEKKVTTIVAPKWDLRDFYVSIKDPKITEDLKRISQDIKKFSQKFRQKVSLLTASQLFLALRSYEEISERLSVISSYAYLVYASDLSNKTNLAFYQNTSEELSKYEAELVFFLLELNQFTEKKLQKFYSESDDLKRYQPFIRDSLLFKKFQLSEELEKFLIEKNVSGRNAWIRLFDETVNNLKFPLGKKIFSSQGIFNLMSDVKEEKRKAAGKAVGKVFQENAKIFSYITNILAKDKEVEDRWRGFANPISARNLGNFIEDEIVEVMVKKVKENYSNISHRYYKIKAQMLGKKVLNYWDRNAPLTEKSEKLMKWGEAKELVLSAYEEFHPEMKKIGEQFFTKKWIDAEVRSGKDSGAFSHPCATSLHPYILMNFQGKVRDVMTLAHELGHGIHQFLARGQGSLMAGTPLTLAETASVFGEQLAFQKILKNEKDEARKRLVVAGKVEDMINTVVRQIAFLSFEKKVHDTRKNGEVPLEKLCQFWLEVQKESLGPVFKFDEEYKFFWAYIPHFIHSPFYVYSYAFGDCLVNSLYGVYQQGKIKNFSEEYLKMLRAGGTKHHKEMLEPFGLSAHNPKFWQSGLDVISAYIDLLE